MELGLQDWDIVNPISRKQVINDVMVRLSKLKGWERSTVYMAVYYMDSYLSAVNLTEDWEGSQGNLLLLGFTCFFVAKKLNEEVNHLSLRNMLKMVADRPGVRHKITIEDVKVI
jgi:hypothetical protein